MHDESLTGYTGLDNLEVMSEAKNYNAFLLDLAARHAELADQIVDFGAGTGTLAGPMGALGYSVICIEPDADLGARLRAEGLQVRSHIGELPDGSIDYVYTFNVLEHIADDEQTAFQLFRALKPGGCLLAYVPAFQVLFTSMDRKVGHRRRYRLNGLVGVLSRTGFQVEKAEYVDFLGFFAALLFKALDRGDGTLNSSAIRLYDRFAFPLSRRFDAVFRFLCGKNLVVVAKRP
jgi:SAM-dependent methyltransferase